MAIGFTRGGGVTPVYNLKEPNFNLKFDTNILSNIDFQI